MVNLELLGEFSWVGSVIKEEVGKTFKQQFADVVGTLLLNDLIRKKAERERDRDRQTDRQR